MKNSSNKQTIYKFGISMIIIVLLLLISDTKHMKVYAASNKPDTLYIGEVKVDLTKKNPVTRGDGWNYNIATQTLYLNNIDTKNQWIYSDGDLNIILSGNNYVSQIFSCHNLKISGKGTLNIRATDKTLARGFDPSAIKGHTVKLSDCTVNINMKTSKKYPYAIDASFGRVVLENCKLISHIDGPTKKNRGHHLHTDSISINKSTVKLTGTPDGIYTSTSMMNKNVIKNSTLDITSIKNDTATGIHLYGGKLLIEKSTLKIKTKAFGLLLWNEETIIKNSKITSECTGNYSAISIDNAVCTMSNSTVTAKGKYNALELNQGTLKQSGGTLKLSSSKGTGLDVIGYGATGSLIINSGNASITGKTYGINYVKKASVTLKKGKITVTGGKSATNDIKKLPNKSKKYKLKAGKNAKKAKAVTKLKSSDKYIQIMK